MHTVVVLRLGEVGVLGLVMGGQLGKLGGGRLGLLLATTTRTAASLDLLSASSSRPKL
jgi:hypothetical protein